MNLTPLDSSRQRASFQIKIFAKFAKKIFFLIFEDFWLKKAAWRENIFLPISQKFLFEKKLFDERNPTV
jgi:hypothetical protein